MLEHEENDIVEDFVREKHRRMKRKLLDYIIEHHEAQVVLHDARQRIRSLEKQNKLLKQQLHVKQAVETIAEKNKEKEMTVVEQSSSSRPVPKRTRVTTTVTVDTIPRDSDGKPILPLQLGPLKLISLGKIEYENAAYHCARHIYPLGYIAERTYMSMVDPNKQTTYTCKVEAGEDGPAFVLQPSDDPQQVISAKSATTCWTVVARDANKIRRKSCRNSISGPEYYGLAHPVVRQLIEELENVTKCSKYKLTPPKI